MSSGTSMKYDECDSTGLGTRPLSPAGQDAAVTLRSPLPPKSRKNHEEHTRLLGPRCWSSVTRQLCRLP